MPINEPVRSRIFINFNPFAVGWGLLREDGILSTKLSETQITVISNDVCRDQYQKHGSLLSFKQFNSGVVCAGDYGDDYCVIELGGPLMQPIINDDERDFSFYQIGIFSHGIGCVKDRIPGYFTSVQYFIEWIRDRVYE